MPLPNITDFLCQKSETIRRYANVYVFKRITTMEQEIVSHEYPLLNNILISVYEWLRLYLVNSVYHTLAYFYHLLYMFLLYNFILSILPNFGKLNHVHASMSCVKFFSFSVHVTFENGKSCWCYVIFLIKKATTL